MAPWPSGKAKVCNTSIPGPIPGGASKKKPVPCGLVFLFGRATHESDRAPMLMEVINSKCKSKSFRMPRKAPQHLSYKFKRYNQSGAGYHKAELVGEKGRGAKQLTAEIDE